MSAIKKRNKSAIKRLSRQLYIHFGKQRLKSPGTMLLKKLLDKLTWSWHFYSISSTSRFIIFDRKVANVGSVSWGEPSFFEFRLVRSGLLSLWLSLSEGQFLNLALELLRDILVSLCIWRWMFWQPSMRAILDSLRDRGLTANLLCQGSLKSDCFHMFAPSLVDSQKGIGWMNLIRFLCYNVFFSVHLCCV